MRYDKMKGGEIGEQWREERIVEKLIFKREKG